MKKADFGIIGVALATLLTAFILNGCNDNDRITPEPGEPLIISQEVTMECGMPFAFKAVGSSGATYVGVKEGEKIIILVSEDGEEAVDAGVTVYNEEWGLKVDYTVTTPCPVDNNETDKPVAPVDGKCPLGYEISDCNAGECLPIKCEDNETVVDGKCVSNLSCGDGTVLDEVLNKCVLPTNDCGEGTVMNPETELCEPKPPLECVKGTIEVDKECKPVVYPNEDGDCSDGYVEGPRGRMCFLESELDRPTPR